MRKYTGMRSIACLAICGVLMTSVVSPEAATLMVQKTNHKHNIATAKGSYANWDGVSDGTQFLIIRAMCALHIIQRATL